MKSSGISLYIKANVKQNDKKKKNGQISYFFREHLKAASNLKREEAKIKVRGWKDRGSFTVFDILTP